MMYRTGMIGAGVLAAWLCSLSAAVQAQSATSRYVKFDLDACAVIERDEESGSVRWSCKGPEGFAFYVGEGDLRYFLGFGPNAQEQRSARQTLSPFNRINDTLELRYRPGADDPHAAILRYFTDSGMGDDGAKEQVLVVFKIDGDEACHRAHIDALANPNANALARQAADDAADFDCASDEPDIIGERGKSPM